MTNVMELLTHIEHPTSQTRDPFAVERRLEARHPESATSLPQMMQGYTGNRASAAEILRFIDDHFEVDVAMRDVIERLL